MSKAGKRRSANPKTYGILVGLRAATAEQKARWEAAAKRDGRSFADWSRRVLDRVAAEGHP